MYRGIGILSCGNLGFKIGELNAKVLFFKCLKVRTERSGRICQGNWVHCTLERKGHWLGIFNKYRYLRIAYFRRSLWLSSNLFTWKTTSSEFSLKGKGTITVKNTLKTDWKSPSQNCTLYSIISAYFFLCLFCWNFEMGIVGNRKKEIG
jgi:hypothetical protein